MLAFIPYIGSPNINNLYIDMFMYSYHIIYCQIIFLYYYQFTKKKKKQKKERNKINNEI